MDRPVIPESFSDLADDALAELLTALGGYARAQQGEPGSTLAGDSLANVEWAVTEGRRLSAERSTRATAAGHATSLATEADALFAVEPDPAAAPAVIDPAAAVVTPEATPAAPVAVAPPVVPENLLAAANALVPAGAAPDTAPPPAATRTRPMASLVASTGINGIEANTELDFDSFAAALFAAGQSFAGGTRANDVVVANSRFTVPSDDLVRVNDSPQRVSAAFRERAAERRTARLAGDTEALVATGGICGPADVIRSIVGFSDLSEPVADSLPTLPSDRGNILFVRSPFLSDVTDGVDTITSAQDAEGKVKACLTIDCPDPVSVQVRGISMCMKVGRMQEFSNPEWVAANIVKLEAAHARVSERALLDDLVTTATAVVTAGAETYGTFREIAKVLTNARAVYGDNERQGDSIPLNWYAPYHLLLQMGVDLFGTEFDLDKASQVRAEFARVAAQIGVTPIWYFDGPTPGAGITGQIFNVQVTGALQAFPNIAETFLHADGVYGLLRSPSIDYGFGAGVAIVDGTLVRTNDVQMFAEIFEAAAFLGGAPAWRLRISTCPNGAVAPRAATFDPDCSYS